jgi:uncharacterized protein (DUF362 family)
MSQKINRRSFIKKSTSIGINSVVLGSSLLSEVGSAKEKIDLAIVKGKNYYQNALKAVEVLGGIEKFVPKNSKVALLPNPQSNNPGTFTKPEIVKAAVQLCKKAGASEIAVLGWLSERYWRNTGIKKVLDEEGVDLVIANMRDESQFKPIPVPRGKILKQARIMKDFFNYDVLINMNLIKEHSGNNLSGALKNLMGLNSPASDRTFHRKKWTMIQDDLEYLDQCIADLNTILHPDLCIIDATEFIITNGPNGPGKLLKPQKVIVSTDPVAVDSYGSTLLNYDPANITVLKFAHEHGIGEMHLNKLNIKEIEI